MAHLHLRFGNQITGCNFSPGVQLRDVVQNLMELLAIEMYLCKLSFMPFFFSKFIWHFCYLMGKGTVFLKYFKQLLCKHTILCSCLSAAHKCQLQNNFHLADKNLLQSIVTYLNKAVLNLTKNKTCLGLYPIHTFLILFIWRKKFLSCTGKCCSK